MSFTKISASEGAVQLDFFFNKALPSTSPIAGLTVRLEDGTPCRNCGCCEAVIGSSVGPHEARLNCWRCNGHRGWVSQRTASWITSVVERFGPPSEAILIRPGARAND